MHYTEPECVVRSQSTLREREEEGMDAVINTRADRAYEKLSRIFADESPGGALTRGLLDGHFHLEKEYDVVVVDMDGALGMEIVCKYREVCGNTLVIWITDDRYFAGVAIRLHIFDFILRPLEEGRFREPLKRIKEGDIIWWQRGTVKDSIYQGGCIGGSAGKGREAVPERKIIPPKTWRTRLRDYSCEQ